MALGYSWCKNATKERHEAIVEGMLELVGFLEIVRKEERRKDG